MFSFPRDKSEISTLLNIQSLKAQEYKAYGINTVTIIVYYTLDELYAALRYEMV